MRIVIICLALFIASLSVGMAKGGSISKADDLSKKEFEEVIEYCQNHLPKLWAIMESIKDDGVHIKISSKMKGPGKAIGKDRMVISSRVLTEELPQFPEDRLIIVLYHEFGHIKFNRETDKSQRIPAEHHEFAAFSYSLEAAKRMAKDGDYGPLEMVLHYLNLRLKRGGQAKGPHKLALKRLVGNDLWEECTKVLEAKPIGMAKGGSIRIRKSVLEEIAKLDGIFINTDIKKGEVDNNKHAILFRSMNGGWTQNKEDNSDRIFEGKIRDGIPHGKGTTTLFNGLKMVGEFKKGRPWNTKLFNSRGIIIGTWVNGLKK